MFVFFHLLLRPALVFLITLALASQMRAQATPASPSPSPSLLPEVGRVVTGDRQSESITKTSRRTFIVERAFIEDIGARTIADALTDVPGINFFKYGAFGAQTDYGIRGTTSAQVLVLRDGMPITAGSSGSVDLGELSTVGVQRIEIVESGASTLYGTGAVGGVINIITGTASNPLLRASLGSFKDQEIAAEFSQNGFGASFERHIANNRYTYPSLPYAPGSGTFPAGLRTNDDAEQSALKMAYHLPLRNGWSARLSAGDEAFGLGVPGGLQYGVTPNARQRTARLDQQVLIERVTDSTDFSVVLSGVAQRLSYRDPDNGGESDTYDGRTQASLKYVRTSARSDLVTGIDMARESAALTLGPAGPPPSFSATEAQVGAYAQYGYRLASGSRFTGGLRLENDAPGGSVLAPALGATISLGEVHIAANLGETFRVPTLIDLYYPGFSNPSLQPEKLTNYDATLQLQRTSNLSFGFFGRNGINLIAINPQTFVPYNAKHVSVNGLQFTAATKRSHHVRATIGITDIYKALDTSTGLRLPHTPTLVSIIGIDRPFDGAQIAFGVSARIVGSNRDNGLAPRAVLDSYSLVDAYVRYRINRSAIATIRFGNLGNERFAPVYAYPAVGRSITFELSTR